MKDLEFTAAELARKAKAARRDVPDIASLKAIVSPADGVSVFVSRTLFVWVPADLTPADGVTSVRLNGTTDLDPGRFRRATFSIKKQCHIS